MQLEHTSRSNRADAVTIVLLIFKGNAMDKKFTVRYSAVGVDTPVEVQTDNPGRIIPHNLNFDIATGAFRKWEPLHGKDVKVEVIDNTHSGAYALVNGRYVKQ
jgi:hypothetical protein